MTNPYPFQPGPLWHQDLNDAFDPLYADVGNLANQITALQGAQLGATGLWTALHVSNVTPSGELLDQWDSTVFRSAKYEVQITTGTDYHVGELRIVHDGTNTWLSEYGEFYTTVPAATFSASLSGGTVSLSATATSGTADIRLTRLLTAI